MSATLYYEEKIAGQLGLERRHLSHLRTGLLRKNAGWTMAGRDVALTQDGLKRILTALQKGSNVPLAHLDFTACQVPSAAEKKEGPADLVKLTVFRLFPNPQMLQAKDPDGAIVTVRVKTNKNFVPKMILHARPIPKKEGWFEMVGRCPRLRGRY